MDYISAATDQQNPTFYFNSYRFRKIRMPDTVKLGSHDETFNSVGILNLLIPHD
jgi:hypothetical protein